MEDGSGSHSAIPGRCGRPGRETIGGDQISVIYTAACQHRKVLDLFWKSARRAINPPLDGAAALYL